MPKQLSFSDQLRLAIKESGVSCYRINRDTGVSQSILSRFMNGKAGLSTINVDRLCECLDLELVPKAKPKRKGGK